MNKQENKRKRKPKLHVWTVSLPLQVQEHSDLLPTAQYNM